MSKHKPVITKAAYDRIAEFVRELHLVVAEVSIEAERVRVITTNGGLTIKGNDITLDAELAEFDRKNGYG